MISQNPYSNCMSARLYYYDFLHEETKADIPECTLNHIIHCPDCQAEINRLDTLLSNAKDMHISLKNQRNTAITSLLKFHFSYVNEPVTCNTVKPFLASMADPAIRLTIPTPITEHIEECENCRDDLHTLQDLHLTHKQLCRLGQFLAQTPTEDTISCSQARQAIPDVASMMFGRTNAETLKHLSTCPDCRRELFKHREQLLLELSYSEKDQADIPCKAITSSDIYDYALPYGIDPSVDEYAEFREPLATHLGGCPTCIAKVQELLKTIYRISDRSESDVVTVYQVDEPAVADTESIKDNTQQSKTINFTSRLRQTTLSTRAKPWLKASVAAAAVLIIGIGLMVNSPTVEADPWDHINSAISKARNLHVSTETYMRNGEKVIQEKWLSQSYGLYMYKDINKIELSDFENTHLKVRTLDTNVVEESTLPNTEQAKIEGNEAVFLELLPFARLSDAQEGTTWNRATGDDITLPNENCEVFDLVSTGKSIRGESIIVRRRYYIDPETNLPIKTKVYQKSPKTGEFILISKTIIKQMSDDEMQTVKKTAFPP